MPLSSDEQVKAGAYRQIFDIEQPAETKQPSGAVTNPPWLPFLTGARGSITTIQGREVFAGDEFLSQATHVIEMRYYPGIVAKMRINFKTNTQRYQAGAVGRLFDILLVNDINEKHRKLELTCRESTRGHGL